MNIITNYIFGCAKNQPTLLPADQKQIKESEARFHHLSRLLPYCAAIASGLLASLAFPPLHATWLCWIAWTPLIATLWWGHSKKSNRPHPLRLLLLGYLAGIFFFWASLFWLSEVTIVGWFLLGLYLGTYPALWALFVGTVGYPEKEENKQPESDRIWLNSWHNLSLAIAGAAAWVALEWIRGFLFTGFGWNAQGVALYENIPLIQIADITGVYGVSFLIILVNLTIVMSAKRLLLELSKYRMRPHFDLTLTLVLLAGAFLYGTREIFYHPSHESTTSVRIACVQAAIPQSLKWDPAFDEDILRIYQQHTQAALQLQPHLLIWPEAATPRPALMDARDLGVVKGIAKSFPGEFLMGTIHFMEDASFNSAVLFSNRGAKTQLYSKNHLVPFGEYIPLRYSFPPFAWAVGMLIPSDFTPGAQAVVFSLQSLSPPLRIAPLICFEDTLASLARLFVLQKANFFAVLTNDGWFKRSSGSQQHLANAVFRSAEFKLPMVRCANTGVTCFINRFGAVTRKLQTPQNGTFGPGILVDELQVPSAPPPTFYARFGDVFSLSALVLSGLLVIAYLVRYKIPILTRN